MWRYSSGNTCTKITEWRCVSFEIVSSVVSQSAAGVCVGSVCVSLRSAAELASALSAWSRVSLRTGRFVEAEATATAVPAFAMTTASRARLVSFALPAPASVTCTGTTTFKGSGTIKEQLKRAVNSVKQH